MPEIFPLTTEQLNEFERRGIARLPGFYPKSVIDEMAGRVWADLEQRFGVIRDRSDTWTAARPAQFQGLKRSGAFRALMSAELFALADALLGAGAWDEPPPPDPLVTFPTPATLLQHPAWHLDIGGVQHLAPLPILRAFTFLEPALPNGGGTLYVAGSHQLALDIEHAHGGLLRSAYARDRLRNEHSWFADLLKTRGAQLRELMGVEARVGDHIVRLEEMTGAPGDLIIMHPAILHGSAHNALDRPRMMLTAWIYRRENLAG